MSEETPSRPEPVVEWQMPPFPELPEGATADPSTKLSEHRTRLSRHRTRLSDHRTDLSTNRTEMSKRRTGMSFQRTRMSADRTLMSVIRTSLSLISFGFTIAQFFEKLKQADMVVTAHGPRQFGMALVWLGIGMLVFGIVYHVQFMLGLRKVRTTMRGSSLIHGESGFPVSLTLISAVVLLLIGIAAIIYMID